MLLSKALGFTREGWSPTNSNERTEIQRLGEQSDSLSICNGCLLLGSRIAIPTSMRQQVLEYLHLGHFDMQRMKQLARTDIEPMCRKCIPCGEHQNKPANLLGWREGKSNFPQGSCHCHKTQRN